jgi:subtilisin family serine protease
MNVLNVLLLVLLASSVSAGCRGHKNKNNDTLAGTWNEPLQAVGGVVEDEYLIYHDKGLDPRALLNDLINSGDAEILHEYTLMNAFSVHMKRKLLDLVLADIEGLEIFDNPVVSALEMDSPVYAWGIDRTDQKTGTNNQYQYERDGTNVDVYILDTGIYVEHEEFEGHASWGKDFTGEGMFDGHFHGTHVAGTFLFLAPSFCNDTRSL